MDLSIQSSYHWSATRCDPSAPSFAEAPRPLWATNIRLRNHILAGCEAVCTRTPIIHAAGQEEDDLYAPWKMASRTETPGLNSPPFLKVRKRFFAQMGVKGYVAPTLRHRPIIVRQRILKRTNEKRAAYAKACRQQQPAERAAHVKAQSEM